HRRAWDAVAVAEPFQQIAVLAARAAEGRVLRALGLAAQRATLWPVRGFRHIRQTWGESRRGATRSCRRPAARAPPAIQAGAPARRLPPDERRCALPRLHPSPFAAAALEPRTRACPPRAQRATPARAAARSARSRSR